MNKFKLFLEKKNFFFVLFLIISVPLFLKLKILFFNYSFWSDEAHVAIFVRSILESGKPILNNFYSPGLSQILFFYISAFFSKLLGLNELSVRLPSVLFGFLTLVVSYFFANEFFKRKNKTEIFIFVFLMSFLTIEQLWSVQARPYQTLQFFFLLSALILLNVFKNKTLNIKQLVFFILMGILSSLFHGISFSIFLVGFFYIIFSRNIFILLKKKSNIYLLLLIFFILFILGYLLKDPLLATFSSFGNINNFEYYRIFLTKNYFPIIPFSLLGILFTFSKKQKNKILPFLFIIVQLILVSFIINQPFTRYFYPVFPFFIFLGCVGLSEISFFISKKFFHKRFKNAILYFLFIFFIFLPFYKQKKLFLFPVSNLSLNGDMQEIPEVDWKRLYGFVEQKIIENPGTILMANWNDLPIWYLGEGKLDYLVRTSKQTGTDPLSGAVIISHLDDLKKIERENKSGLLVLDSWDNAIPKGVLEFSQKNLKKEFEIDRLYPVQPRYWTVWVYSWGLRDNP